MDPNRKSSPAYRRGLLLTGALLAMGAAHAAVGPPGSVGGGGGMENIGYGNGGNVFQLEPMLFVQGLGSPANPLSVTALNPALHYAFSVSGAGTSLMTIEYRIGNTSASEIFTPRFMLFTNPDGDSTLFQDVVTETWGPHQPADPDHREARDFDPVNTILNHFVDNNSLTEGFDAKCQSAPGCDATVGLQWNAPEVGPGQVLRVVVGLSDNGQHLSSRWIDVTAQNSPGTVLTLSGVATVATIPEPASAAMLAGGLGILVAAVRRRARR